MEKYYKIPLEEILRVKYVEENKSLPTIAQELDVSIGIVHKWISKLELHRRIDIRA